MNCQKCGYSLPEGSVFCPNCGTKVGALPPEPAAAPCAAPVHTQSLTPPAPAPAPAPDPVAPPPPVSTASVQSTPKKAPTRKVASSSVGKNILIVVLAVVCVLSAGLNVYQFILADQSRSAEKKLTEQLDESTQEIETLQEDAKELRTQIKEQSKTIEDLNEQIQEKDEQLREQESSITELNNKLLDVQAQAEAFNLICSELRYENVGYAADNYYASTGIVIMDKWNSEQFTVRATWSSAFTITLQEANGIVDANWGEDWHSDGETVDVIITPTGVTGVDIITFTNNIDSKTFKVLVIVTD